MDPAGLAPFKKVYLAVDQVQHALICGRLGCGFAM